MTQAKKTTIWTPCLSLLKNEDWKDDMHRCLLGMIRNEVLLGESINQSRYWYLGYWLSLLLLWWVPVVLLCSITLPKDFTEMGSYVANMDDLLPVLLYYPSCSNHSGDDSLQLNEPSMTDSSIFEIVANSGKNRKRPCNIIHNHWMWNHLFLFIAFRHYTQIYITPKII